MFEAHCHNAARALLTAVLLVLAVANCHNQQTPVQAAPRHSSADASEKLNAHPSPDAVARARASLNAAQPRLPAAPEHASVAVQQFYAAATRATRLVYEDDVDDASQLQALQQRLEQEAEGLQDARAIWRPIFEASLTRAATLRLLGPTLRALRQAIAASWRDEIGRTYRQVDAASCRAAHAHMPTGVDAAVLADTIVTIEPLGPYPLRVLLNFCDDPKSLFNRE